MDENTAEEIGERERAGIAPDWHTRTIRLWDEGEDVRALRDALGLGTADNRHDPDSEAAVRRFQSERGLPLTGEVDADLVRLLVID